MTDEIKTVEASGIDGHKTFEIVVNGRPRSVDTDELTYDEVVRLAFDEVPSGPDVEVIVSYRESPGRPSEGLVVSSGKVKVGDGTVITVWRADKS